MSYKVLFHVGDELRLKTKGQTGRLILDNNTLLIEGDTKVSLPAASLRSVELFRLHGLGRTLKVTHADGTLFVSVVRFTVGGLFAVVDFFGTGRLRSELQTVLETQADT